MNWKRLRKKVLSDIYPSKEELEEIRKEYEKVSRFIEDKYGYNTHFAGSASRGTAMKNDNDLDIFVLFPESVKKSELEDQGLEIGKSVFEEFNGEYEIEYAEHPYTKGSIDGFEVEIVPCYETSPDSIKSSVDRTPHHSKWVEDNLDEEQRKDVVILKKLLQTEGIYGSSLKVEGFSGYLCEVLIAEYGGFKPLMTEALEWKKNKVVDPENHHEKLPAELEKKFSDEPFVVIDPVDQERNVASVLTEENYSRFIYLCWRFNTKPGLSFFREEEVQYTEFEVKQEIEKRKDFVVIEFENPEAVDDVIHPQMRKTLRRLESELKKKEFRIFESGYHIGDKTRIFFEMERELPENEEVEGPSVFHGIKHLEQFTSKYGNVYIKDDRVHAKTTREFTDAKKFLKQFLSSGNLEDKGVPHYVAKKIKSYSFSQPVVRDEKWLNYLGEKLNITKKGGKN